MEWILTEETGFEKLESHEISRVLKWALPGSHYNSFHYYVDFFKIDLINESKDLSIEMCFSDFRFSDNSEWLKIISSYPFNLDNACGEEEPARGFLLTLLTQFEIKSIEVADKGSLLLNFDKGYEVRVEGEIVMADISWTIKIFRGGVKVMAIMCTDGEIFGAHATEFENILGWRGL